MQFEKHFCRIITIEELSDGQVIDFFDVVQSVTPTKILVGYSAEDETVVSIDVIAYVTSSDQNVYEILLADPISQQEGDEITNQLMSVLQDVDFDFEISLEV